MTRRNDYISKIDKHIGDKIYLLRLAHGLSRPQLAKIIGVTHQQLQKYEKGINRLSVGRLALVSKAMAKDISYFYADLDTNDNVKVVTQHQRMCLELCRNFMKIERTDHQTAVHTLVKSLSKIA